MAAFFSRPWDSQPQEGQPADAERPICAGLVSLFSSAAPISNAAGGALSIGSLQSSVGRQGVSVTGATTSGFISSTAPISGDRTIAFYCRPASAAGTKVVFTSTTGSGVGYWIGIASGANWSIGGVISGGTDSVSVGSDQLIVVTKRGTTHSIWVDGIFKGSGTSALADGSSGFTWLRFGTGTANSWTSAVGVLHMGATWSRALSDFEVAEVSRNPWQLFEPQRIFIPVAAGGGGVPTLSLPTYVPGSLTSVGFRPRVTAT